MSQSEKKISRSRKERATTVAKDTASPVPGTAAVRRSRRGVVTALMGMARGKASTFVDELGRIFGLMFAVLVRIPRRPWRPRAIAEQVWFVASVTLFPALLLTLSFGLVIGLQVYNITRQFGAESAQGAAMVLAIVREAGPLGTTFMLAAAAGTAITADIGSRTVRDEIAAMQVMAVDPIHRVVVPRVVGASIAAGLMTGIVIMGGLAGGFLYSVVLKIGRAHV